MADPNRLTDEPMSWFPLDPEEETERVASHLEMLKSMLSNDLAEVNEGISQTTQVRVAFFRLMEREGMQAEMPQEHYGIVLGVDESGTEPQVVMGRLELWLSTGESDEQQRIKVGEVDLEVIPIREINNLYGAPATPETWDEIDRDIE